MTKRCGRGLGGLYVQPSQLRELYLQAEQQGCVISRTKGGHVKVLTPSGAKRTKTWLRRAGVEIR
jgi:hypothetical protein